MPRLVSQRCTRARLAAWSGATCAALPLARSAWPQGTPLHRVCTRSCAGCRSRPQRCARAWRARGGGCACGCVMATRGKASCGAISAAPPWLSISKNSTHAAAGALALWPVLTMAPATATPTPMAMAMPMAISPAVTARGALTTRLMRGKQASGRCSPALHMHCSCSASATKQVVPSRPHRTTVLRCSRTLSLNAAHWLCATFGGAAEAGGEVLDRVAELCAWQPPRAGGECAAQRGGAGSGVDAEGVVGGAAAVGDGAASTAAADTDAVVDGGLQ